MAECAVEFCNLAAGRWNEPALKAAFYQDLNQEVLTELLCHNDKLPLDPLIDRAIHMDHLICNCQVLKGMVSSTLEIENPMELG